MNIPTYSNVPVMLVYFKLFYYDVALYPIFEVCNVLRVQIGYKRVADGSQAFPICLALFFTLNPQLQILRVNIHVGSTRLRFVVRNELRRSRGKQRARCSYFRRETSRKSHS